MSLDPEIMEMKLKFVRRLSLKEMALRRLTAALWSSTDILDSIWKFRYSSASKNCEEKWLKIFEPEIRDRVLKLNLPESLTEQMLEIARPIGLQIKWWKDLLEYHFKYMEQNISLPDPAKLCWTHSGTIDYRRTVEELVRCDKLDVELRYLLACINCLEDDIPLLWEKLPEKIKHFHKISQPLSFPSWWLHMIKSSRPSTSYFVFPHSRRELGFNQWMFENSVDDYNKNATEYFFQKFKNEVEAPSVLYMTVRGMFMIVERKESFAFQEKMKSEIMFYLLSQMNNSPHQMMIFKRQPLGILFRFLDWPWKDLFLENALLFWKVFHLSEYGYLLREMYSRLKNSDLYFPKLFPEFFKLSPVDFKKYFVGSVDHRRSQRRHAYLFLRFFLESEDLQSIGAIFSSIDAEDRAELVLNHRVLHLFHQFIMKGKPRMVKACLRDAALSEEHRKKVKEHFTTIVDTGVRGDNKKSKFKEILEFLDGADAEKRGAKRKLEEC